MSLATAPASYSREDQDRLRSDLKKMDRQSLKRGQDIEVARERFILSSPNGNRWAIAVSNAGVLSAVAVV